ncbi:hypothetical protein F511_00553 [Dorcoceras hygrometricum]|uniref:Integral membrane bound transporter domain-containing protein n=1 Tax=Dorcoceras hygrometricum TaxID=472368 RepID=A0A2Z7BE89_9LAMI|nr:hypothetical protein F511_00553 [Dorcoceras hygrometricum]
MWRRCLASVFRTAFACSIVGGVTLYGPESITRQIAFPAFSYVTVILIVTDATLGDTLRSCWLAFYGTVLGVFPAVLSLSLIGPEKLNTGTTAVVVGISAFVVALPENTHLISKRIALGQIVLVYVIAFIKGAQTEVIMHPMRVATSTAVGVVACVVALLFPFPGLAIFEVKENFKLYLGNASERSKLVIKAFSSEDIKFTNGMLSQAKFLNITASKLIRNIESKQDSMKWEPTMLFKPFPKKAGEKMRNLETALKGMEISLTNCTEFPVKILGSELKNDVNLMEEVFLNQVKNMGVENATLPQPDMDSNFLQALKISAPPFTSRDLPALFFIFCSKLIHFKPAQPLSPDVSSKQGSLTESEKKKGSFFTKVKGKNLIVVRKRRLMQALRCSFSLGFAVLFGLLYSRENGYWAGLPVAISYTAAREPTFRVSNVKYQGTTLGTVFGLMGCFLFNNVKIRFVSLIPWFLFCSFLRTSKMYGHAGAISAVIGAVLILGRDDFGSPGEFAVARIVETFIGLSCSIMVDMMLQPTRAAVLAKVQLSESLQLLCESVGSISFTSTSKPSVEEMLTRLKIPVNELGKLIEEAEVEPNIWFFPFHSACYRNLKGYLSKMVDFLLFVSNAIEATTQESRKVDNKIFREVGAKLEADLMLWKHAICCRIKNLEEVVLVKSLTKLENEYDKRKSSLDLESGKSSVASSLDLESGKSSVACAIQRSRFDDKEMKRSTNSPSLQHLEEIKNMEVDKDGERIKKEVILSLSALFFCMNGVSKEIREMEKGIEELVQWENPSSQVDLHGILSKVHALGKSSQFPSH